MNKNQVKGSAKKLSGKTREVAGKVIGSKKMERKGKIKRAAGEVQSAVGDAQAEIERRS